MIFKNKHNNKPDLHFRIEIDDKHIEKVEVTKFLGILIDNNLSWKAHTNHITKIVSKYCDSTQVNEADVGKIHF